MAMVKALIYIGLVCVMVIVGLSILRHFEFYVLAGQDRMDNPAILASYHAKHQNDNPTILLSYHARQT